MIDNKKVLAIVPARSGSKGLPGKNLKEINGIPLVAYPIISAEKSSYIDNVLLTTNCPEIAKVGRKYGALTPFIRPEHLASDTALRSEVILHALDNFEKCDILIFLEPTSPLTTDDDINKALDFFVSKNCRSLVSVAEGFTHHPEYAVTFTGDNVLRPYLKDSFDDISINRQDLDEVYFFDGSLYISDVETFKLKKEFYHSQTRGIVLDDYKSLEIDSSFDLEMAKFILKNEQ